MAQWLGQFTGNTHASKVADREAILRDAITRLSESESAPISTTQLSHLESLADRVLHARHKLLKAKLSQLLEPSTKPQPDTRIARIEQQILQLEEGGPLAILKEFHAPGFNV